MDKSLVSKATSADEAPTPGYMFNEISRITHTSAKDCTNLEEFLLKRLKKDHVHQKLKTLKVIKHCCQQGHSSFRRELQRHTGDIKECLGVLALTLHTAGQRSSAEKFATLSTSQFSQTTRPPPAQPHTHHRLSSSLRLIGYRGTPDPLHGDALNKAVRDMAQVHFARDPVLNVVMH